MKGVILKYKWHLITFAFVLAAGALILWRVLSKNSGGDKAVQEVADWVLDKRLEMTKEAVERDKAKKKSLDSELQEVEDKIKAVEEERAKVDSKVDRRSLKELDDAWKKLGY
jgi:septal ring factor EnvC (AmiA/AmiB activator)